MARVKLEKFPAPRILVVGKGGILQLNTAQIEWFIKMYQLEDKTPRAQKMAIKREIIAAIRRGLNDARKPVKKSRSKM